MTQTVTITSYDPDSKRYRAKLTVTADDQTQKTYTCEGTWDAKDASMVAKALYDQHLVAEAKAAAEDVASGEVASAIQTEVDKLVTIKELA